jgi:hypothetical protein
MQSEMRLDSGSKVARTKTEVPTSHLPEGLAFNDKKFETAKTCLAFTYLREISSGQQSLASQSIPTGTGSSPG